MLNKIDIQKINFIAKKAGDEIMKIYQQDFEVNYKKDNSPLTKADIYPRLAPTMEWDIAAGQAIVEQAGGEVLSFKIKKPLRYNKKNLCNFYFYSKKQTVFII